MVRITLLCSVTALDRSPYDTHTGKQTEGRRRGETRLEEKRIVTGRMSSSHKMRPTKGSEKREDLINQIRSDQIRRGRVGSSQVSAMLMLTILSNISAMVADIMHCLATSPLSALASCSRR
jgi:hypothetical protein